VSRPDRRALRSTPGAAVTVAVLFGLGCAGRDGGRVRDGDDAAREARAEALEAQLAEMEAARSARDERIRELEGHLALSQAEAQELARRMERQQARPPTRTVRIGDQRESARDALALHSADQGPGLLPPPVEGEAAGDDGGDAGPDGGGRRPVLRLYGSPDQRTRGASGGAGGEPPELEVPPPPPGVSLRIPVRTVPWDPRTRRAPARVAPVAPAGVSPTPPPTGDPAERLYRAALSLLTERRYRPAAEALTRLIDTHPEGRLAPSARYWRGEAYYALRSYDRALVDFRALLTSRPGHRRAPEALYKVALCLRRRGDADGADRALRQLRERYPGSPAARMAEGQERDEEDAS